MKTKVRLFINGRELEFSGDPAVLYNFNLDSVANPTAIKNQYTKQIQVEGTSTNNKIFGDIWDVSRIQTDGNFNPSKRTPFELYIDGELYETGYVKLNSINRTHNKIVYNITLFGGIGDFLYNLTYLESGEKMSLKDLAYLVTGGTSGDPVTELDFKINKGTVNTAWNVLSGSANPALYPKYTVINFAPAYNGYPDGFDSDKVLINTYNFTAETRVNINGTVTTTNGFPTALTLDNTSYKTVDGYGYGEINGKMTEWEMRDLRSYLQRPVLRMKAFINACCDPTQNGGYEVSLDPDFFTSTNDYYEKAWMTLPMLNNLKYDEETVDEWLVESPGYASTYNGAQDTRWYVKENSTRGSGVASFEIKFRPQLYILTSKNPPHSNPLYCAANISNHNPYFNATAFVYQMVGYDYSGNVVCGSDIISLTSSVNGRYLNIAEETAFQPLWQAGAIYNKLGTFAYGGRTGTTGNFGGTYDIFDFSDEITLKMNSNGAKVDRVVIRCVTVANLTNSGSYQSYGDRQFKLYTATSLTDITSTNTYSSVVGRDCTSAMTGSVTYNNNSTVNSNAKITKQNLLALEGTPCDYLVGYLKIFGLYLRKDPLRKRIEILTRPNYYNDETVYDWNERIDHTKSIEITPLTFQKKWYNFNFTQGSVSASEEKYFDKYGVNYGTEKVNTGYNFDNETEDLLKGIAYINAVDALEKSPYFIDREKAGVTNYPTMLYSWVQYSLMRENSDELGTVSIGSTLSRVDYDLGPYGALYDNFTKVQLRDSKNNPVDGSGVLVFYTGSPFTRDSNNNYVYYTITDDVTQMFEYGDNTCWLWTSSQYNQNGDLIAYRKNRLPRFTRCIYESGYVTKSWDFGKTKELYTPYTYYNENANIYDIYWKLYVNDLYDINTRAVNAYVKLPKEQGDRLLRRFYWFDNSLWRINKINDWNVCADETTMVQFIKIQDKADYLNYGSNIEPDPDEWTITMSMRPDPIPASGGVITFTVYSDSEWFGNPYPDLEWVTYSSNYTSGSNPAGTTYITAVVQPNTNPGQRRLPMGIIRADDARRVWEFWQEGNPV